MQQGELQACLHYSLELQGASFGNVCLERSTVHAWGPGPYHSSSSRCLCWSSSGECLFSLRIWSVTQINHVGTVCQCQWFSVEILPLSSGDLSWPQDLLKSSCVLCSGKGHCGACPWFPLDFIPCAFCFFFFFLCWLYSLSLFCNKHLQFQQLLSTGKSFTLKHECPEV